VGEKPIIAKAAQQSSYNDANGNTLIIATLKCILKALKLSLLLFLA